MILACQNIKKAFGTEEIISDCSFHLEDYEKAAVIGINGAGKSTLLKMIVGELSPSEGEIILAKGKTMGYLAQHQDLCTENTIYEELLTTMQELIELEERIRNLEQAMKNAAGKELESYMNTYSRLNHEFELKNGYAYQSELVGVLKGLGFSEEDFCRPVSALSGGQKTRVSLGKLLLTKPDIILLDEPTNHLDMTSIAWLENYLLNYKGAVLIVSHDRYFLDKVVSKVIEIECQKVRVFQGNYSDYAQKKAMVREAQIKAYLNQQQEIKHQEEVITKLRSFNREKSIRRAESREKLLNKIEVLDKPAIAQAEMHFKLEPQIVSGTDVLTVEGLSKSYPPLVLFENLNFEIKRGEKVAIIGNNGTGKTTILKIINQLISSDSGEIKLGSKVQIGYYDQEHHVLHSEKTLFDEISDTYPHLNNTQIRNVLAAFLFTNDDVFKRISDLSGGEKGRVSLAKLMLSKSNLLILDEPTNHLDISSKEILETAISQYTGTVLYVSHDRYFINKTATRILDLTNKQLVNYIGNYDYYLEKKEEMTRIYAPQKETASSFTPPPNSETKLNWKKQKEEQAKLRKRKNELDKIEKSIEELENRNLEIDRLLTQEEVYTNTKKCLDLNQEKKEISDNLDVLYEKWETLSE